MQTVKEATASVVEGAKSVADKLVGDSHDQKPQEDTKENGELPKGWACVTSCMQLVEVALS